MPPPLAEEPVVGVVGAGLMGRGIAAVLARQAAEVRLFDTDAVVLADAVDHLSSQGLPVRAARSLTEVVQGAAFVTEAIAENLALKQSVFAELDAADPHVVLATNTSVLPVTRIAEHTKNPGRVVGTHWWNPPDLVPVVEVVRGTHTDDTVMADTVARLTALGKLPVRVEKDVPGFVGNRLQHALWREAIALVADGICDARTVDLVVRNTIGLRLAEMGPLQNADYVGLDLTLAIHDAVLPALNRDPGPSALLKDLVTAGRLGAKSRRGFFDWDPGERETVAARLAAHVRTQLPPPTWDNTGPAHERESA
ncbi:MULTISPECIES: 3-hydroxyacyl-CoA dehydrogenase family protein [Streptomyces]|uniref:3-hydroxyacyl-CoA dehydrogenase family protein n=1 Tax=Streptomyces lycopersici TaxID=2974589 RepID=UPI0021D2823C|nr:3-hydroxyacyl-CoA dehydrogenase NAD-binding domain-containing protein [Streptomyces sp. NEAU-383]